MASLMQNGRGALPFPSLTLIAASIPHLSRDALEGLVERLIDRLDELDGDPDRELTGDEADGSNAEDEIGNCHHGILNAGPGCAISDPGEPVGDDEDEDIDELDWRQARRPDYGADQRLGFGIGARWHVDA